MHTNTCCIRKTIKRENVEKVYFKFKKDYGHRPEFYRVRDNVDAYIDIKRYVRRAGLENSVGNVCIVRRTPYEKVLERIRAIVKLYKPHDDWHIDNPYITNLDDESESESKEDEIPLQQRLRKRKRVDFDFVVDEIDLYGKLYKKYVNERWRAYRKWEPSVMTYDEYQYWIDQGYRARKSHIKMLGGQVVYDVEWEPTLVPDMWGDELNHLPVADW